MNRKLATLAQRFQLVLFDLDKTLVGFDSVEPLANVTEYLAELKRLDVKTAIVTNQGGPACKHNGFKGSYPEVRDVRTRVDTVVAELRIDRAYICWAYLSKDLVYYYPAWQFSSDDERRAWKNQQAAWRKPESGMLRQAARDAKVMPQFTLVVGDSDSDRDAAKNFGCEFMWAWSFFDWPQPVSEVVEPVKPDLPF